MKRMKVAAAIAYMAVVTPLVTMAGWSACAALMTESSDVSVALGWAGLLLVFAHAVGSLAIGIPVVLKALE